MLSEGLVLADRYEITGKIGTGGMSDVYKAKDHKLNRFVAIKVLKNEFSENKNFVSKFRVEAQSAAILMHSNIVTVYDVGDEDGIHYIVMELVEGITLKKYIEKKLRLSVKEAVSIAINVSMGIESAHNNHIIHRDIKPQNIIISKDGKVKVTDFGIARAATSNTITSNAMGSVHYTSPEQARGGYSDEKSDIYSLGVTLYEMLTGRVPFDGETTVSIAIKHIQEEMPSPREYVDDIPVSVEQIIRKCCQKNPARRYQTMGELIVDLKKSLITPDENFVVIPDLEKRGNTRMVTDNDIRQIRSETGRLAPFEDDDSLLTGGRPYKIKNNDRREAFYEEDPDSGYYPESEENGYEDYPDEEYEEDYPDEEYEEDYPDEEYEEDYPDEEYEEDYPDDEYEERYEKSGAFVTGQRDRKPVKKPAKKKPKKAPQKKGGGLLPKAPQKKKTPKEAPKRTPKNAPKKTPQKPAPRRKDSGRAGEDDDDDILDPGTEKIMSILGIIMAIIIAVIAIILASRMLGLFSVKEKETTQEEVQDAKYVNMIAVTGMSFDLAKEKLEELGLSVTATYQTSKVEKNQVIGQDIEAGTSVLSGSVVELMVSSGQDGVVIPDVSGLSEAEARVKLENEGFVVETDESASNVVDKGNVISQIPGAGESWQKGGTVTIYISTGPSEDTVEVPDLKNLTEAQAREVLTTINLTWNTISEENSDTVPVGCVISQSVAPGSTVNEGEAIDFVLSVGPAQDIPQVTYYSCNYNVNAPSMYAGGVATVTLTQTSTGTVLFSTNTTSFPVAINLSGIQGGPEATLSIKYTLESTVINEKEDGSIESKTTTEEKTETQNVTLTPQN